MKPENTIEKLMSGTPLVIAALGDSLTNGWMVRKGYLDFLNEFMKKRFQESKITLLNKGIPGDTAQGGLHRLERDVLRHKPDCVFVQFGLNDAFVGCSPELYRKNIEMIISRIMEGSNSEIVLIASNCLGSDKENVFIEVFYNQLEELAKLYRLPIARVHEYWKHKISEGVDFKSLVQFDLVHPTAEGYRLMAEAIMEVF